MTKERAPRPLRLVSPLHKAIRQMSVHLEARTAGLGLKGSDGHLLSYLAVYGPAKVAELRRVFGHKPSTMTSLLDRFERAGWITREMDPLDRRSFRVAVTELGEQRGLAARHEVEAFEKELLAELDESDVEGFAKVVAAIGRVTRVQLKKD